MSYSWIRSICFIAAAISTPVFFALNPHFAGAQASKLKFDPRLSPEYVEFLKAQAEERKKIYADQAKQKRELKESQLKEQNALLEKHRVARAAFSKEQHPMEERSAFFKSQRNEMLRLQLRQKEERKGLNSELNQKLSEFHASQKDELRALKEKLSPAK